MSVQRSKWPDVILRNADEQVEVIYNGVGYDGSWYIARIWDTTPARCNRILVSHLGVHCKRHETVYFILFGELPAASPGLFCPLGPATLFQRFMSSRNFFLYAVGAAVISSKISSSSVTEK